MANAVRADVPDKSDNPLEGKSGCAFRLIFQFLDKREHSRTRPTQRQRAPRYNVLCPSKSAVLSLEIGCSRKGGLALVLED